MKQSDLLNQSTRVALAAYLHDLGKFAERADISEAEEKDTDGNSVKELNKQQYCPNFNGRYSHVHAAYTAIAMDVIEKHLPDIKKSNCSPFASWSAGSMGEENDSLINAAARHHKPETFLQWVIATADRLSSGFERSQFDEYNQAEEGTEQRSYKTARMEVLLEKISLLPSADNKATAHRYTLKPLSPLSLIPVDAKQAEPQTDQEGTTEYKKLWDGFLAALKRNTGDDAIPQSHKNNLPLWLDHFDSLWLTFTHCIPSATAAKVGNKFIQIPADVSLYDHAKSTAALATALWRWHAFNNKADEESTTQLRLGNDYSAEKFLLIQGDMFGIQDFIFQQGGSSSKFASKLLRGRSFYVSLMAECAALRVLDALDLPPTSQITNAAGKFLIVAPNTQDAITALEEIRRDFDKWSLEKTQGRAGLGLAWTPAASNDFITFNKTEASFSQLLNRLFAELETQKFQRLQLWKNSVPAVLTKYIDAFTKENGVCQIDGVSPAIPEGMRDGIARGQLAIDQIAIGNHLAKSHRVLISREKLAGNNSLGSDILGFYVHFTKTEEETGRFAAEASSGNLLRCWDFSLPADDGAAPLWNGYARRYINGYVAKFEPEDLHVAKGKYKQFEEELDFQKDQGEIKTFNYLACENRLPVDNSKNATADPTQAESWVGTPGLHALKGDVDDLGAIFQTGYKNPNFAKMAGLSRQVNAFFAIYLPWLCKTEFKNTYTVFAGGDDFFLLGAWKDQMHLANTMSQKFHDYVAKNSEIHFSAGLHLSKPGLPIRTLCLGAEDALEKAKAKDGKNAVTCFNRVISWHEFNSLIIDSEWLDEQQKKLGLSTGFIYGLLELSDMADSKNSNDPQKAIWRSQLTYRTARWINDKRKQLPKENIDEYQARIKQESTDLICKLANKLQTNGSNYHVPLYTHLYTYRD